MKKWQKRSLAAMGIVAAIAFAYEPALTLFAKSLDPIEFSAADLMPGGTSSQTQKEALFLNCVNQNTNEKAAECQCFVSGAVTNLSYAQRQNIITVMSIDLIGAARIAKGWTLTRIKNQELTLPYSMEAMRIKSNKLAETCGLDQIY